MGKRTFTFDYAPGDFVYMPAHQLECVVMRCAIDHECANYLVSWLDPGCQIVTEWVYGSEIQPRRGAKKEPAVASLTVVGEPGHFDGSIEFSRVDDPTTWNLSDPS